MKKTMKIAYIGGGSKQWARVFMSDLAVAENLGGEFALYDIDLPAAERNAKIGERINQDPRTKSIFHYKVYTNLEDVLSGATFVVLSILPGTFKEMRSDVHTPEKVGIFQSVGDTAGPGGVLRAMRTVPIYEGFAKAIQKICPDAWVINFTNPMSICIKTLFDVFPKIKAFGCCHEVFNAQNFLTGVLKEIKGIQVHRSQIYTDACGVNHFTWITEATYGDLDLLSLLPEYEEKFYGDLYLKRKGSSHPSGTTNPFACGNKVKLDLYNKYGVLAAAGDRHLAEFMPSTWYLKDEKTVHDWEFNLTTVDWREADQAKKNSRIHRNGRRQERVSYCEILRRSRRFNESVAWIRNDRIERQYAQQGTNAPDAVGFYCRNELRILQLPSETRCFKPITFCRFQSGLSCVCQY
jgi:alpha-galactosidase